MVTVKKFSHWLVCLLLGTAGCGASENDVRPLDEAMRLANSSSGVTSMLGEPSIDDAKVDTTVVHRKIIYTGQIALIVEDFADTEKRVAELVKQLGGYIAESNVDRTQGRQRSGKWVVRIPIAKFEEFLNSVVKFGVPETRQTNAQDITEEYIDLEARIVNKREIEKRIIKLLDDRSGEIKDVIAVETELGRVREEIERIEGKLRYLSNMAALTTVTISAREQQNYVPPQAPTFIASISKTWSTSIGGLIETVKGLVLLAVSLAPWILVAGLVCGVSVWVFKSFRLRKNRS